MTKWPLLLSVTLAACGGDIGPAGQMGARGNPGPPGERGPAGPPGNSYRPVYWVSCGQTLDLIRPGANGANVRGADGLEETRLHYTLLSFNNGDLDASCSATLGAFEASGDAMYYPAITKGATTGTCLAPVDYMDVLAPSIESGFWQFSIDGGGPKAVYRDSDNPFALNGFDLLFRDSACAVAMAEADGKWTPVTLADVF